jgi:hypothetical protein
MYARDTSMYSSDMNINMNSTLKNNPASSPGRVDAKFTLHGMRYKTMG